MSTLTVEDTAVVEAALVAYDAIFPDLGPEARGSFASAVESFLVSDLDIPEVKSLSKATNYSNFNYNNLVAIGAKIRGSDLTQGENQEEDIAEFVARDLKIAGKIVAAVDYVYTQSTRADDDAALANSLRAEVLNEIDKMRSEKAFLEAQLADFNNPSHPDFNASAADSTRALIQSKSALIEQALTTQAELSSFGNVPGQDDKIENFVQAYKDFLQLRIDEIELARHEYAEVLKDDLVTNGPDADTEFRKTISNGLDALTDDVVPLYQERDKYADFEAESSIVRKAGISAGTNVFSAAQGAAGYAKTDGSVESHVTNLGFLGEAAAGVTGDILDATGNLKVAKGFKGAAALSLVAGLGGSFVPTAKLLNDPNLTGEQRRFIEAEVGLQGTALAFGAVENVLNIAELGVQAGTKAANVLGKAAPIVGAIASVVGAINPAKWQEFSDKQQRIDAISKSDTYSSGLLSDLLQETKTAEAAFYGVTTALDLVTGVGSAALAASGVGAPIAGAIGIIGGAISAIIGAFEQVALEDIADKYAEKIRTDENGNEQTVEEFFDGSFDVQQEKTKAHYVDFFSDLIAEDDIDQIIGLGGQGLDVTDIELAARTKTSGELNKTAKNYVETFTDAGWQKTGSSLIPVPGESTDIIQLANAQGAKSYLTFTSPLFSAGTEETTREETGKNEYQTTLKITDLSGWRIRDFGNNQTTFNLSKVVSSAEDRFGNRMEVDIKIEANGGDDTLFAYEAQVEFDGGAGIDTASYARLSGSELADGLSILSTGSDSLVVSKYLAKGSKYYQESIDSQTTSHGKRTEKVQYRAVKLDEREAEHYITDTLKNIEILHGSALKDHISIEASLQITQVFGFGGDDTIIVGDQIEIVGGGDGNDTIELSHGLVTSMIRDGEQVYIDGGGGAKDAIKLSETTVNLLVDELETHQEREALGHEIAEYLTPVVGTGREEEVAATAESLGNIFRTNDRDALKEVFLFNTETVKVDLEGTPGELQAYSLSTYRDAVNHVFTNANTADGTESDLDIEVDASAASAGVAILGTDHADTIQGSYDHDDYIFGGAGEDTFHVTGGNDVYIGGEGQDLFNIEYGGPLFSSGTNHILITGPEAEDIRRDIINFKTDKLVELGHFRYGDDHIISIDKETSITIDGFYTGGLAGTHLGARYHAGLDDIETNGRSIQIYGPDDDERNSNPSETIYLNHSYTGPERLTGFHTNDVSRAKTHISGRFSDTRTLDEASYSSDVSYYQEFRSSYLNFLRSDNLWATRKDGDTEDSFANHLATSIEDKLGAAKVSDDELAALLEIANIRDLSRTEQSVTQPTHGFSGTDDDEYILGNFRDNVITGGAGDDIIEAKAGNDTLDGGEGYDLLAYENLRQGGVKLDLGRGGHTHNVLVETSTGQLWPSTKIGERSNFEGVVGTNQRDHLIGNADNNYLEGGNGNDTISGGAGNDVVNGGAGVNELDGGAGFDILSYKGATNAVTVVLDTNGGASEQSEHYQSGGQWHAGSALSNFEGLIGSDHADALYGSDNDNYLEGGKGADYLFGFAGNDTLNGGEGLDTLDGGDGFDTLSYKGRTTSIDIIFDASFQSVKDSAGQTIDVISGFEGIVGSDADDFLRGSDADNNIEGGAGNDELAGRGGSDAFIFRAGHGRDVILDFTAGEDRLVFHGIDAGNIDIEGDYFAETNTSEVRITTGTSDVILLLNTSLSDVNSSEFIFV
ncbi:hypothetical protein [Phaeobacter inhibens]|uniref:hypothetical protein n=1 Tax=Phaeobacter inhibens TaxID=221822 RepID=UPI0021A7F64D|nr:hypothetical protein [Phaeobacter inhibens]UWR48122.1 hypothetical protein K4F87_12425 [Phaeobacter inhibens]